MYNYQHQEAIPEKQASCNCSGEVRKLWEQLSNKKLITESVQQVQTTQKPVTILTSKNFCYAYPKSKPAKETGLEKEWKFSIFFLKYVRKPSLKYSIQ